MNTIRKFLYLFLITMLPALPQAAVQLNSNSSGVNQKMVENQMRKVENDTRMSEEQRKRLLSLYQDTTGYLESAKAHKQSADNYNKQRINAPAEIASLEKHLDKVESKDPLKSLKKYEHKSLDDTRVILLKVQANLTAIKTKASSLEQQIDAEATRPDSITTRLTDIQNELSDLASTTLPEEDKTLQQALNWRKLSHSAALNAEIGMLDSELTSQPARVKLLRLQLKRERRSIKWVGTRLTYLENLVAQKRQQASEETLSITEDQQARAQNKDKPPLIRKILEKNSQLALQLKEVSDHLQQVSSKDRHAEQQAEQIKSRSRIVEQKLRITGLSQALGYALQIEKRRLPSVRQYRKATRLRESLFAKAQLNRIQFRDEQMRLSDRQTFVDDLTRRLPAEESEALQPEINTLLDERNTLLEQLISTTDAYISAMNKLDLAERQVLQNAQDMQQLLDENLLWVRSSQKLSLAALENFREELDLLSKPQPWSEAANIIFSWRAESSVALLVALLAVLIWISSAWIKRGLAAAAYQSQHEQAQSIRPSLTALLLTLIRALPFPILLMAFSLQLANLELDRIIANNLHQLTLTLAPLAFGLLLFKHLCDQNGLARVHFSWSENSIARLTRATRWLLLLALPLGIVSSLAFEVEYFANNQNNLIPKTALLGALITLAYTLWYLFNPRKGVLRSYAMLHPDHSLNRSHYVWFGLLMLYQAALIVLVVLGYNYTAGIFARYLVQTLLLFGLITLMYHLAIRWLRIMRYRLAMQAWQEKQAAKQEAPTSADSDSSGDIAALEEQSIDLGSLNEQTRKLIKLLLALLTTLGLWLIWSSVLPALNILDDVSLWHHMRVVNGEEKLVPVTLVDLFMSIAVIAITVFAAKNLPMLLEALLLQRFSLSSGSRYATTNLVTYSIAGIGIVLAFTSLGLSWSSIQWLVAALGVGIGFGLQEIVANFICGIIILFERPIRVGDVVSVGNVDGIVTKIRIRATTIRNWDRQELLVPNKEFITQQLLNWTLSDQTTRLLVPVGVAYGSDVRLASELMLKAAKQHPRVLDDPKATVFFETFGDNTLNLQMRCFIVTTHPLPDRTHLPGPSE